MPDEPTEPRASSTPDLDAGWGDLLDEIGPPPTPVAPVAATVAVEVDAVVEARPSEVVTAPQGVVDDDAAAEPEPDDAEAARPRKSAPEILAQMARMLDVGEGTGPIVDLRAVLGTQYETSSPSPEPPPEPRPLLPPIPAVLPGAGRLPDDAPLLAELDSDVAQPIDVRDEAPRRLAVADAVPRPIEGGEESWPRADPAPLRPTSDVQRTGPRRSVPTTAAQAGAPVAARAQWPWIAGAAAVVVALGWLALRPGADVRAPADTGVALAQSAPGQRGAREAAPKTKADPASPNPEPTASRVPTAAPIVAAAPRVEAAAPTPSATPPIEVPVDAAVEPAAPPSTAPAAPPVAAPPAPTTAATATPMTGSPAELLAGANAALAERRFEDAHALAQRAWRAEHDNEAVRVMVVAACENLDGGLARSAFRKLEGPPLRKEVTSLCRARGVDLRASADGDTPAELLAKARRAADGGDHPRAYELARASNRAQRSADALALMATGACHAKDATEAAYLIGMLPRDRREAVTAACVAAGTTP